MNLHREDIILVDIESFRSDWEAAKGNHFLGDHARRWYEPAGLTPFVEGQDYHYQATEMATVHAELLAISPVVGEWEQTRWVKLRVTNIVDARNRAVYNAFLPNMKAYHHTGEVNEIFA